MPNHELNENWSVSLKIVVPIIVAIIGATGWITTVLWKIESRQNMAWMFYDMRGWSKDMAAHNPGIIWTDPSDVFWSNRTRMVEPVPIVGMKQ